MAEVRTVISRFTVDDQVTVRVQGMTRAVQTYARAAQGAARITFRGPGGGFALPASAQGFIRGASGMSGLTLEGSISEATQALHNFATGGSMLARVLTLPTRLLSGFGNTLAGLGVLLAPLTGGLSLLLTLFGKLVAVVGDAIGSILRIIGDLATAAAKVLGIVGAAAVGVGIYAARLSMESDTLERSFGAFLGSVEKGRQAARFVEFFGLTSPFEQKALQEAARSLLAVGLDLGRFLQVVQNIALIRGPEAQNIVEVAELVMRAMTGATGFVFGPRGLMRFGITRADLEAAGARFQETSVGLRFLGGAEEAIRVLENLGRLPKVANIGERFETSPAVRFSNALDAVNRTLRQIGDVLLQFVIPVVEAFAEVMLRVGQSGIFATALDRLFGTVQKKGEAAFQRIVQAFEVAAAWTAAIIANLPQIFSAFLSATKQFISVWLTFFKVVLAIVSILNPLVSLATLLTAMKSIEGFRTAIETVKSGKVAEDAQAFLRRIREAQVRPEQAPEVSPVSAAAQTAVATFTRPETELARADFRRFALGGGDIGRFGLTEVERARIGALGGQPTIRVRVSVLGAERWTDMLEDLFERVLAEYERARPRLVRSTLG